jgi:hypothetical protein
MDPNDITQFQADLMTAVICGLWSSETAEDGREAALYEIANLQQPDNFPVFGDAAINIMLTQGAVNDVYNGTWLTLPQFEGSDCDICEGP